MSGEGLIAKPEVLEGKPQDVKLKSEASSEDGALGTIRVSTNGGVAPPMAVTSHSKEDSKSYSRSPTKPRETSPSATGHKAQRVQTISADISVKMEPGQPLKLARSSSQKVVARPTPLFDDLPDMTAVAKETFQVLSQCIYAAKYLGTTEHAMECDCAEEWGMTS